MMTGVAYAQLGGMPVMVITGQKPIKKSKQGSFQVVDVVSMMRPITKFNASLVDASRVASSIAHAFLVAEGEKPWAVHLELAEDIAREDASGYSPLVMAKVRRPIPDHKAIASLIEKLEQAKRPIILVGAGANRKRVSKYLTSFIQKHNIPFFCSQMGKGVVDERLAQYVGTAAVTSGDYIHEVLDQADLIIAIGHDTIEKPTNVIEAGKTQVVNINFYAAQYDELYKPSLQIIGDIGNTLWQLYEADIKSDGWKFDGIYQSAISAHAHIQANASKQCCPTDTMTPAKLVNDVREVMGEHDIISLDNGLYKLWFARNYPTYFPNTLLLDNALATMGAGYACAMIATLLNPGHQVVAIVGDGWFLMNLGDVQTAVTLWLDLTILVLNDGGYGMIKWKQASMGMEYYGLKFDNPDFVRLAESFGARWYRIDDPHAFKDDFAKIVSQKGVKIIDLPFEYPKEIL